MPISAVFPISMLFLAAFAIAVLIVMSQPRKVVLKICKALVISSAIIAFCIYTFAYLSPDAALADVLFAALRGLLSTVTMYLLAFDYYSIADWLAGSALLQWVYWIANAMAMVAVHTFLIYLFGRKLVDLCRLRFGFHKDVYMIIGSSDDALMLGENIAVKDGASKIGKNTTKDEKPKIDKSAIVVFLLDEDEDEDVKKIYGRVMHFGGIVRVLDKTDNIEYHVRKIGLKKRMRKNRTFNIILMQNNTTVPDDVVRIAKHAKKIDIAANQLHLFVFVPSVWERKPIEKLAQQKREYPCTFHIINETGLLSRKMIENYPPYKCKTMKFDDKGMAERGFNVMILGFGTVGQEALLRLILNGQFVTQDGSRMRALIVDKDKKNVEERFRRRVPQLDLCCEIEFEDCDVRDKEFFEILNSEKCNNLDYIVVALSSNEDNKETARDIEQHFYDNEQERQFPDIAVSEKNEGMHSVSYDDNNEIFTFGCKEEIYSHSVIIREETDKMAQAIHEVYGGNPEWYDLNFFLQESNRAAADFIPAMLFLAGVEEKDVNTEKHFVKEGSVIAETLAQTEHMRWNAFHVIMGYRSMSIEDMKKRFNKYADDKGTPRERLDFARRCDKDKLHACLVHWNDLDDVSKAYKALAQEAKDEKEQKRDFKNNDRENVLYIPKFLEKKNEKAVSERNRRHR